MYQEPLVIPIQLAQDKRISSTAKLVFALMSKLQKERQEIFNQELREFFNLHRTQLKQIKSELAKYHYLTKVTDSRGGIRYVLLDPSLNVLEKIKQFLRISTVFRSITALELLTLHPDPARTLYVMEVFEFTYRKSEKKVEKPLFLLKRGLAKGVTPDKGFMRDWWLLERQRADETAAEQRERLKKEATDRERALQEQKAFEKYLASLTSKQLEALREHATARVKENGGLPKFGLNTRIRIEMIHIWKEGLQNAGHARNNPE